MKLEQLTISLPLAKRLYSAGVTKDCESYAWWREPNEEGRRFRMPGQLLVKRKGTPEYFNYYPALTFEELLEIMPLGNEWSMGWSDACCGYTIYWGSRGAGAMMKHKGTRNFWHEDEDEEAEYRPYDSPLKAFSALANYLLDNGLWK